MAKNLKDVLNEIEEQEQEAVKSLFDVTDLEGAAEAHRRIVFHHERMAQLDKIMEEQIAPFLAKIEKIKAWNTEAKEEHLDRIDNYRYLLEEYMRAEYQKQVDAGKKPKKSIKLPFGSIALKKQQPEFEKDEDLLYLYAEENDLLKVKREIDWASIKAKAEVKNGVLVDENGEIVPGVKVKEREDKFEVKVQ